MSGEIEVSPGFLFETADSETLTYAKLNKLVEDLVLRIMAGAVTNRELADGTITADKLDPSISAQLGVADGSVTTAKIVDGAVTDSKLRDGAACSVIGRSANTIGEVADIAAASNNQALVRASNALSFVDFATVLAGGLQVPASIGSGFRVQFGTTSGISSSVLLTGTQTITFPTAFAAAPTWICCWVRVNQGASLGINVFAHVVPTPTASQFTFRWVSSSAPTAAFDVCWMAIGTV